MIMHLCVNCRRYEPEITASALCFPLRYATCDMQTYDTDLVTGKMMPVGGKVECPKTKRKKLSPSKECPDYIGRHVACKSEEGICEKK